MFSKTQYWKIKTYLRNKDGMAALPIMLCWSISRWWRCYIWNNTILQRPDWISSQFFLVRLYCTVLPPVSYVYTTEDLGRKKKNDWILTMFTALSPSLHENIKKTGWYYNTCDPIINPQHSSKTPTLSIHPIQLFLFASHYFRLHISAFHQQVSTRAMQLNCLQSVLLGNQFHFI